jgi:hypothetical protein
MEKFEVILRVLHLIERGLFKYLGNVMVAFLSRCLREVGVLVASLRLTGKRSFDVFFGFAHECAPFDTLFVPITGSYRDRGNLQRLKERYHILLFLIGELEFLNQIKKLDYIREGQEASIVKIGRRLLYASQGKSLDGTVR